MAGPQLARDEAGNIWEVDAQGNPVRLHSQAQGPNVVMPAPPKAPPEPKFVPEHPNLVYHPDTNTTTPIPGVPAAPHTTYRTLSPAEIAQHNLNPQHAYQISSDGDIKDLGGTASGSQDESKRQSAMEATRDLVQSIEKARGLVSNWSTGLGGRIGQMYPGSDQANQLETVINQEIRGNIFKNWVAMMKAQSDTGGTGIGRIMQSEIPLVTGSLGALDPIKMGRDGTIQSLNQIEQRILRTAVTLDKGNPDDPKAIQKYRNQFLGITPPPASSPPPPGAPGIVPPPSGPTGGNLVPSTNGYNDKPDPASAAYWDQAAHSGEPYRAAMAGWSSATGGKQIVSPPDPKQYRDAVQYMQAHPNVDYHPFQSVTRTPVSGISAVLNGVAQSPTGAFFGHAANAATASLPQLAAGDQGTYWNAVSHQQNPTASTLGDITGTVVGAVGAGKGVKAIAPSLGRFGNLIGGNAARAGLTGDTLFGGVSGMAQNPDHPVLGGVLGATAMAAGNVGGRYILGPALAAVGDTAVGQGIVNAGRKARGMFGGSAPQPFSPPSPLDAGPRAILGAGAKPFDDITANLQDASRLNLPYALADADPRLRVMAGSAARKSPDVRTLAEQTLIPRQLGQGERAIGQINDNLAPVGDVPSIMADARVRAQSASAPLYDRALQAPVPTNDPQLMEMLNSPAGKQAARNAYNIALNNGENPAELSFATDPQGNPITNANPNWKTLQYIKTGLDKVIKDHQNPVTGKLDLSDPISRSINDLRAKFVNRLGELNPDYAAANQAYRSIIGQGSAAERGAAATGARITPEQTQLGVANAGDNLPYFQRGYASNMADMIERQPRSGNPYDLVNGSIGQQSKLATVFPQGVPNFMRAQGLEGDMAKTAYETLGGSPTAARFEADKAFDSPVADAAIDAGLGIAAGVPPTRLAMRGIQKLADTRRLGLGRAKADAVGPLLLNPDPNANLAALDQWIKMNAARQAYLSQVRSNAGQIGAGMFGAPLTYGLSQN